MKRVLAILLLLTLTLGLFAGCKPAEVAPIETEAPAATDPVETTAPVVEGPGAEDAMTWLKSQYQDDGALTAIDYTRYGTVRVGKTVFNVVWTVEFGEEVENPEELIQIEILDEGATVKVNVNEECEEDTPYKLTATITDANGNVATHTWNYILPKGADMVSIVEEAYNLKPGESFDHEVRLKGKIISLDSVYDANFQNITVTIEVEGAEGKPIKCYRLKGEGCDKLLVGNIITVSGIIKNYEGTIEFDAGCILEAWEMGDAKAVPTDPGQILKEAYALAENEVLGYPATLTGTVTAIDSPYDPNYSNISVIITIEGYEQYPILCYRLKGTGVDQIAIKDLITVTGIIKNYKGTIEYDTGCQLVKRVSGGGVAEGPSSDANKILADAAKLGTNESLPYIATLTGTITSIDTPYSADYGNVTVTMKVNGVKIQCYRMVGDGINLIRESDTITVTGKIKNYNGKLEFDTRCNLDSWTMGPRPVGYGPLSENTAYLLYLRQTALGKNLFFNGKTSSNKLYTSEDSTAAASVFVERVSGKGVRFYYMDGETKTYIEAEEYTNNEGKIRGSIKVTTSPSLVWKYNSDLGTYVVALPTAGNHFMGTYNDKDFVNVSWVGYIDGTYASSGQIIAKFILPTEIPDAPAAPEGPADPEGDTLSVKEAIDLGLSKAHNNYTTKKYYVTGKITEIYNTTYGNMKITDGNGNVLTIYGTYDATGANRFDAMTNQPVVGDTITVYGIVGQFNDTPQIKNGWITAIDGSDTPENPDTPVVPPVEDGNIEMVTSPEAGVAYKLYSVQGNVSKTLYFAGTTANKDYYFATTEDANAGTDVYLEAADGGYYLYFMKDGVKTYIDMILSGTYYNLKMATAPGVVYTFNEEYNTLVANVDGQDCYIGTYDSYTTLSCSKISYLTTGFAAHLGVIGEGGNEPEPTEPTQPEVTEPGTSEGDYVKVTSASQFTSGKYVMVVSTGYAPGEFLASGTNGWLTAVQPVVSGNTVTDAAGGVWTLTVSGNSVTLTDANGVAIKPKGGNNNGILSGDYQWSWSFANGTFRFAGHDSDTVMLASNANTDPTYGGFHKFRAYKNTTISGSPDVYPCDFTLYKLDGEYVEPDVTEPDVTEPTQPEVTEPSGSTGSVEMVTAPEAGKPYKLYSVQGNVSKTLYFAGTTANKDYYFATTEDANAGTDVYLEAADGGYYLYFMKDGVKTYIDMILSGTYYNLKMATAPGVVYTFNEEYNTLVANVSGQDCYIGTYDSYTTLSCSKISYLTTGFAAHLGVIGEGGNEPEPTEPTQPEVTEPEVTEPEVTEPAGSGDGFVKITSADQFVSGKYVMVVSTGYAPGEFLASGTNGWLTAVQPVVSGNSVTDPAGGVWTLTVSGNSVTLTDANGVAIKPKGGNNNGILSGDYQWSWSFANGTFRFAGHDSDTVMLASNANTDPTYGGFHKFRAYKNTTISGSPDVYPCDFTLYKLGGEYIEPDVTEPTQPEATEPPAGPVEPTGDTLSVKEAIDLGASMAHNNYTSKKYYVTGKITEIYQTTYGNMKITDGNGNILTIYGTYDATGANRFDAMTNQPAVGDTITVYGIVGQYNNTPQIKNGWITSINSSDTPDTPDTPVEPPVQDSDIEMVTAPEAGKAYKLYSVQGNVNKTLYFAGTTANKEYYFATTEDSNAGTDVYLEAADGGYYLYFMKDGVKTYIDMVLSGTYYNLKMATAPGVVYTFNEEYNTLVANVSGQDCYIGTYDSYTTLSCSKISYLTTGFVAHLGVIGEGSTEPEVTEPEETTPSTGSTEVAIVFSAYGPGQQYTNGETYEVHDLISLYIVGCHMNNQLRIYSDDQGDGNAIFTCAKAIRSVVINAGYKAANLEVYGSVDGQNWVLVDTITTTTSYADYTVDMPAGTSYKYLKLDAVGAQIRVANMTITLA